MIRINLRPRLTRLNKFRPMLKVPCHTHLANIVNVHFHKKLRRKQHAEPDPHGTGDFDFPAQDETEAWEGFWVRHMVKNIRPVGGDWRAYCSELGDFEEVTVIQQSRFCIYLKVLQPYPTRPQIDYASKLCTNLKKCSQRY